MPDVAGSNPAERTDHQERRDGWRPRQTCRVRVLHLVGASPPGPATGCPLYGRLAGVGTWRGLLMGGSSIGRAAVFGTAGSRFESWAPSNACLVVKAAHRHGKAADGVRFSGQARSNNMRL